MIDNEMAEEAEPPSGRATERACGSDLAEQVIAVSHAPPAAHVAVIGHHTLPYVLALMRTGCGGVRSLRPDAPAPDCEPADLTWIVDCHDDDELDGALRAARGRAGTRGCVVLEAATCRWRRTFSSLRDRALRAGLEIVSFDHATRRVVLAPAARLAMAA